MEEAEASIEVTKTADKTSNVKVGDTITYTITVENTGNVTVSGLTVTDPMTGLVMGTLDKTTIAPGETATVTATYVVTQDDVDAGTFTNTATATGKDPKNADVTDDDSETVTTEDAAASIEVTKTASKTSGVKVGETITYTITVEKIGRASCRERG